LSCGCQSWLFDPVSRLLFDVAADEFLSDFPDLLFDKLP